MNSIRHAHAQRHAPAPPNPLSPLDADDSGALKMAGQGESELVDVEPPAWLTYGAFTRAGHDGIARKTNQDAYVVCPHLLGESEQFLFGVFDGHGTEGHFVSRAVTRLLPKHVTTKLGACAL